MKKPILVVMAAGIGSRYGGLKQMDPIGANGELIIDYSVFDAIKAGFNKVIFIINHKIEHDFKKIVGDRLKNFIEVDYVYQELNDLPEGIEVPKDRVKPWGTAHAIYSARHHIDAPFAVINADDYYGKDAFVQIYDFLSQCTLDNYDYAMVGFQLEKTITEHGYVSRGVCTTKAGAMLEDIVERTHIEKRGNSIAYLDEQGRWQPLSEDTIVSMNMWGFTPTLLEEIQDTIAGFMQKAIAVNPLKCEFFLPFVVGKMLKDNKCKVKVLETQEKWYGITYSEDKAAVVRALNLMTSEGKYPNRLWEISQ